MAKYNDTKFYWLQLKEDFFEGDAIDWLESQDNGSAYALFYLKLCLKSLKTNGVLIRRVGEMLIPYDATALGKLTGTPLDTVKAAMVYLTQCGLVNVLENGELYLSRVETMIGAQSTGAFKKQQQRLFKQSSPYLVGGNPDKNAYSTSNKTPDKPISHEQVGQEGVETPDTQGVLLIDGGGQMSTRDRDRDRTRDRDRDREERGEISGAIAPLFEPDGSNPPPLRSDPVPYLKIQELFNETCKSFPKVSRLSENRKKAIAARWKEYDRDLETFRTLFEKAEESSFLKGNNDRNWAATFDWLMKPGNMVKVLEGNYDNKEKGVKHHEQLADNYRPLSTAELEAKLRAEGENLDTFPDFDAILAERAQQPQ